MKSQGHHRRLIACTGTLALLSSTFLTSTAVFAQQADQPAAATEEIVVTGSRIRQTQADQPTPLSTISAQQFEDNGYVQAGQALNNDPSMNPSIPQSPLSGRNFSSNGSQTPGLFGLGSGRTLTLIDGQRMVSTTPLSSGVGFTNSNGASVDPNLIPVGLLDRVDIVQAGGAAVYGSDAIAGVINYVLKDHFQGAQLDVQGSISDYGDYPVENVRFTAGTDFFGHKGNVAVDIEWSKSQPLYPDQRPEPANLDYTANGAPPFTLVPDYRFWVANNNGVVFTSPAPTTTAFLNVNGSPVQFAAGGTLQSFNPGTVYGVPFAGGGQGYEEHNLDALETGVERQVYNLISHYDVTDHLKVSASLLYGRSDADDPKAQYTNQWVLNGSFGLTGTTVNGAVPFYSNNPYLPAATVAQMQAAYPAFGPSGVGKPLYLSVIWPDLLSSYEAVTSTETYRGRVALDGDFDAVNRNFYWSVGFSHGLVHGDQQLPALNVYNFAQAINAATNASGQIVCAVNAVAVTYAGCSPINPFSPGAISKAAQQYVTTTDGYNYRNTEDDLLATLGGSVFTLPAGDLKFSVGFEHRADTAQYVPAPSAALGLVDSLVPVPYQSGEYHTNEYSAELQAPVLGKNFSLPFVQALDLNGAFRHVDNSLTASENVWDAGVRWQIIPDIALRGSLSCNFRAPLLSQVFAPTSSTFGSVNDPCDFRNIGSGLAPATRLANCTALFTANPTFGLQGQATIPAGSSVASRIANFQDPSVNFATALVTTSGNPNLLNEVSHTQTYGVVLQPRFLEGFTFTADRIQVHLVNGLSQFTSNNFLSACYDTAPQPASACGFVTRDPTTGFITKGTTSYYNAGFNYYHGELYNLDYTFPVSMLFGNGHDDGKVSINVAATHTTLVDSSVTGFDLTIANGTTSQPNWVGRLNLGYTYDDWRIAYQAFYRGPALSSAGATANSTPFPHINANVVQNISVQYTLKEHYQLRFGINNLMNTPPSWPTLTYGDLIGRQYIGGLRITY